jgi:hypothetical protein
LQGHTECLRCASRAIQVVESRKTCHFCFIPLFPMNSVHSVVCTNCHLPVVLQYHCEQSASRQCQRQQVTGIPVAKLIVDEPAFVVEMTENSESSTVECGKAEACKDLPKNAPLVEVTSATIV